VLHEPTRRPWSPADRVLLARVSAEAEVTDYADGSLLKPKGECGCGCGLYGTLKKPNRAGIRCVKRDCTCASCRNKRNRTKGDRRAAKARKTLGLIGANSRHEEHYGGPVRYENKAGAQVGPILTRYLAARAQSEAARPIGDNRPFVFSASPDGVSYDLFIVRSDELEAVVFAMAEAWGAA